MNIGVIGAGALGLSAAYHLGKSGYKVTVFESAPFIGGQASTIEVSGSRLERGYHHLFTNDTEIIDLMGELGISDRLQWFYSSVGTFTQNKLFPTTSPMDLIKFGALPFVDRLKLGISTLRLRRQRNWRSLEKFTADEWLYQNMSSATYKTVWQPLLRGKFGAFYQQVGMPWVWSKIQTRFASRTKLGREVLGYPRNSFDEIFNAIVSKITQNKGQVLINSPVTEIICENGVATGLKYYSNNQQHDIKVRKFDCIISTVPSFELVKLVEFPQYFSEKLKSSVYLAALVIILVTKKPLTRFYWINIADASVPFLGLIEHTNLVPISWYNGKHILYITNYLSRKDPLVSLSTDELLAHYLPHLCKFNKGFNEGLIENYHYNYVSAAQPLIGKNYSQSIPSHHTPVKRLYMANTTQIYPEDRGTNYSIKMGRELAEIVQQDSKVSFTNWSV